MRHALLLFLMLGISVLTFAEPPDSLWSQTFGTSDWEECWSVQQTTDSGYILGGYTQSYGAGDKDFWLVKTDANGTEEWNNTFGGSASDFCYSVQQTTDGGYILGGYTNSYGAGSADFWLVKTNANGDSVWSRTFGGTTQEWCHSIQQTSDGGYVLAGFTESYGAGGRDFWLVKTDANGDSLWSRTFGGISYEICYSLQQTADGGYILGGSTSTFGAGNGDFWLVKTDANGDSLWSRTYGGSSTDIGYSVHQTTDGGYIFGGYTGSFGSGNDDFWLVKTDANGDSVWSRTFGGSEADQCHSLQQTADGGYVLGGYTESFGAGVLDFWLVRTNANGDSLWSRTFGGYSYDRGVSVRQTTDTGYIFGGYTQSFGASARDFWMVKTGPDPVSNQLSGSLSGTLGPGEYHIIGDISVESSDSLTLMPGTVFKFDSLYEFQIDGMLLAEGTESDSIVFTADTVANPARWRGLRMDNRNGPDSRLAYCLIENGLATSAQPYHWGGGVYCSESSPTFTHCVIRNNRAQFGGGVYCYSSSASFMDCIIHGNTATTSSGGVCAEQNCSLTFTNCTISNNSANRAGGFLCYFSSPTFTNCTFNNNVAGNHGGGFYCSETSNPTFTDCVFQNNEANYGGGLSFASSSATFTTCTISGNTSGNDGGGMILNASSPTLTNCIISDNTSGDDGGGVNCFNASPNFTTCIISGNTASTRGGGISCENNSSPTLTDCAISGNSSHNDGGGMYCYSCSPDFTDCTIRSNSSVNDDGGGVYCQYSSPTFAHCTIDSNYAQRDGGGLNFSYGSSPTVTDCIIRDNTANSEGGGMYCYESTSMSINCTFKCNTSHTHGGGAYCYEASPTFANCIFNNNSCSFGGGGLGIAFSSPTITRCTISENSAGDDGGGMTCIFSSPIITSTVVAFSDNMGIWLDDAAGAQFKYCNIFGNSDGDIVFESDDPSNGPPGIGQLVTTNANDDSSDVYYNILLDPMFVDTAANDYHLLEGSPCIDAGDPSMLPDSDGTVVEIGAFYFPQTPPSYTLSPDSLDFGEVLYRGDSTLSFWIHNPTDNPLHAAGIRATDTLIFHAHPTSAQIPPNDSVEIELTFMPRRNISYLDSVQISFGGFDENETVIVQGTGIYDCHVLDGAVSGTLSMDCNPYYVAGDVTLEENDTLIIEAGIEVIFDWHCQFLVNGLLLAIGTAQDSIKFTCDTLFNPNHWGGIHFYFAHDSCRMEYCVIEKGRAEGDSPDNQGGGIFCSNSSPTFAHCTIMNNWAENAGGGVHCRNNSSPAFTYCTISSNAVDYYGGGIYCSGSSSSPSFLNCTISNNSTSGGTGGGLHCSSASPIFTNCSISGNSAVLDGGGIEISSSSSPTFTNCIIDGNSAIGSGGGLHCTNSASPSLDGCTINRNTANEGAGVYSVNSLLTYTNCTINNNMADYGGGILCFASTDTLTNCTITGNSATNYGGGVYCRQASSVFNSTIISFSDGDGIYFRGSSEAVFEYCDVYGNTEGDIVFQGGVPSNGPANIGELAMMNANGDSCDIYYNIFLNPMFIDTAANDYHLLAGSPCIDAGDPDLPLNPDSSIADIGAFYYMNNAPLPFNLLSPTNGDTVGTFDFILIWEASSDPDPGDSIAFYRIYIAQDSAFNTGLDSQDVNTTEFTWEDLVNDQTYWWRVKAFDTQDKGTFSNQTWNFTKIASAISLEDALLPTEFTLHQNYPNPFNPTTTIRYDVKQTGLVSVKVFDILGREVAVLVSGTVSAGFHKVTWDAQGLPSGLYLCRMEAPGFEYTRKLVLLK